MIFVIIIKSAGIVIVHIACCVGSWIGFIYYKYNLPREDHEIKILNGGLKE